MGFELSQGKPLNTGFTLLKEDKGTFDETWVPVWGDVSRIRNNYNEYAVTLRQGDTNRTMVVRFRLSNDGLGFRSEFSKQAS